jgi:hypothetical protein
LSGAAECGGGYLIRMKGGFEERVEREGAKLFILTTEKC